MNTLIILSVCIAVCVVRGGDIHRRLKRGSCDSKYSKLDGGHTMCLSDAGNANPKLFSAEEKQTIVDQHNNFRAKAAAAGMMKMVWDDDVAKIAQKWSQQCKLGHEHSSILRATPTLNGVVMGQNAAEYPVPSKNYDYKFATNAWHSEINYFTYGSGLNTPGKSVGHYTQVLLEDASRVGCGRTVCGKKEILVCNYVTGQTSADMLKPYEMCTKDSCKTKCMARDASGLCDCKGKVCLNNGKLDKSTCTCKCGKYTEGPKCQTMNCDDATDGGYTCPVSYCHYSSIAVLCPVTCKFCPDCDKVCQNGGTQNTAPCLCDCPPGFTGDLCETAEGGPAIVDPNDKVRNCYVMRNGIRVYRGKLSKNNGGNICQSWGKTKPQYHRYTDETFKNTDGEYPENIEEAENFCRDPSSRRMKPEGRLWCYNVDATKSRWDWCDAIPKC